MLPAIGFQSCPDKSDNPLISLTLDTLSSSTSILSCDVSTRSLLEGVKKISERLDKLSWISPESV